MKNQPEPFTIAISDDALVDLRCRLAMTRTCHAAGEAGWDAGTDPAYLDELVQYWKHTYEWRRHEAALNRFAHFKQMIDGFVIHFVHVRGKGQNPFPLLLTHGYPDSFFRFLKIIPLLTDPQSFGGQPEDAFTVVVPDLPGYGFSGKPLKTGALFQVNDIWARLMSELGYQRFGAHGGDWGSTVT